MCDDSDFLSAFVTHRPNSAPRNSSNDLSEEISSTEESSTEESSTNTNCQRIQENTSSVTDPQKGISTQFFPEALRSFPKATDRKPNSTGKQKRTTAILTDTLEKIFLVAEKQNVNETKMQNC
ncbi:hypothetical protein ILUMI_14812 [Ignelater luminosus]|uniref:Uncharacterized protein n=1 Tax=Ignelater luminosus TaxID=2038154 RepID=A0A8K0GA48_IGNLU|nr:hypothetical protein ILUMI_14812 [Ignelater luminosus]